MTTTWTPSEDFRLAFFQSTSPCCSDVQRIIYDTVLPFECKREAREKQKKRLLRITQMLRDFFLIVSAIILGFGGWTQYLISTVTFVETTNPGRIGLVDFYKNNIIY